MNKRICSMVLAGGLVAAAVVAAPATAAKPKKCKPFVAGEMGAEAETLVVTNAHTADAPLTYAFNIGPAFDEGLGGAAGHDMTPHHNLNVQVDSKAKTAGLYVTWEFQTHRDYDLWAYNPDGTAAASAHGFQPLIDTRGQAVDQSNTASNHGGESTATSENLVGIITPDCGGYTLDMTTYFGEGGDFELKIWLGKGETAPGVPG
jgi:hypothetical protein